MFYFAGIIEYIAGYTLRKAKGKFPQSDVVKLMCQEIASLNFLMKKKKKQLLLCPNKTILSVFAKVYEMFNEETTKPGNKINFDKLLRTVLSTSFYKNFLENLLNDDSNSESQPLLKYVISLFIKVLSHRYAKTFA